MTDFKAIEGLQEDLSALKSLTTSRGWDLLKEVVESQIQVRRNLEDAKEIEDFFRDTLDLARLKAERRTLSLLLELPFTMVEQLEEDLSDLYEEDKDVPGPEFVD